jgi:hypothetical protein
MICETTDFVFPMQADIYYPIVEQGTYGNLKKQWILDKTIAGNFNSVGSAGKEDIVPNVNITQKTILIGRVKSDIRVSSLNSSNSITNIVLTNIRDANCNYIYIETSGPRASKSTIFEIATQDPFVGPFGSIEYYNLVIRRSENQAVDL